MTLVNYGISPEPGPRRVKVPELLLPQPYFITLWPVSIIKNQQSQFDVTLYLVFPWNVK